jgi:N-acetyl-1-D-myo-inositol-2-amino-2-deoxy-alpha-D-glucopyranoside deacetylase
MSGERLLACVAHPDDESFGLGSLLAHARARGMTTTVCCATRGEAGEVAPVALPPGREDGTLSLDEVGAIREGELRAAAAVLGVENVRLLGPTDSGMGGEPAQGTLAACDTAELSRRLAEAVDEVRPAVVVTVDGSDGHRDHERVRDATLAALDLADWQVPRAYLSCLPRSLMRRWVEVLAERTPSSEHLALAALRELGTDDAEITTVIDTAAHLEVRWRAIAAHASQVSPYEVMPPDLQRAFLTQDRLRRVRPAWRGGPLERDLVPGPAAEG